MLPGPVPRSLIDRIEAGDRSRQRSTIVGGLFGLLAGVGTGIAWVAIYPSGGDLTPGIQEVAILGATCGLVGAGIGALFPSTRWKLIYPQPQR